MIATIDAAGRLVIPKPLRDRLGFRPGKVVVEADGNALRVEIPVESHLVERDGHLSLPEGGPALYGDQLREFRFDDQR
ncbi:MAG: AbrB/MazE/SpoVT family DNA-binding domain-containing protein [Propionibacteriaceae bacterium]|jgi:AbrB family looped-hinge helix DNA binding protein|nr:AbrB/MazE/SpoVT family DNA-binding domain-containing protein [Propionibacteriaceae bacterium]